MTVSRVVNGDPRVRESTREKVLEAVRALDYVPNPAARSLAGGRHCRIVLIHANPSAAFLSELLVGALAEAVLADAELVVETRPEAEDPSAFAARLASHRIDACLLPAPLCDDPLLVESLSRAGLPVVQIATGTPSAMAHAVTIDDEAAAHAMTRRLVSLGHRRIGLVCGAPDQTASALRRAGYERALAEAGITVESALIEAGDFTYRSGMQAAERLLDLPQPPSAIFASNDDMAAGCMASAHRRGLDVPRDLSICGFDDTAMATTVWPELTTIRQPIARMARSAVQIAATHIRRRDAGPAGSPQEVRRECLPYELVARDSDGPAPAGLRMPRPA